MDLVIEGLEVLAVTLWAAAGESGLPRIIAGLRWDVGQRLSRR